MKYFGFIYSIFITILLITLSMYLAVTSGSLFFPMLLLFGSYINAKIAEDKFKKI